jgi:hypothetical protein
VTDLSPAEKRAVDENRHKVPAVIRLGDNGEPAPWGLTYWQVDEHRLSDRRRWFSVLHDGWVVAEVYEGPDGWRVASTARESIPAVILGQLPTGAQSLLCPRV